MAALGLRGKRRYVLYVRDTQERADDSVSNIATLLLEAGVERELDRYGQSKGWRRNRIRAQGGFTVDALGLDVAGRGVKLEDTRPDVIIFDDVDGRHDSTKVTDKKQATITDSLLPAGTDNVAVVFIQNLIIPDGVVSRLVEGRADYLSGRIVSGPHPAVEDLRVEEEVSENGAVRHVITGGKPTWAGQGLAACQRLLDRIGLRAFMRECQHRTRDPDEAIFDREWWQGKNRYRIDDPLREIVGRWLSLDLAMKDKERSSFNALSVLEISNPGYYLDLRYVWRKKLSFPRLAPMIGPMASRWNYDGALRGLIIEDKAHGITAIQTIEEGSDEWLRGLVIPLPGPGECAARYRPHRGAGGQAGGARASGAGGVMHGERRALKSADEQREAQERDEYRRRFDLVGRGWDAYLSGAPNEPPSHLSGTDAADWTYGYFAACKDGP